MEASFSEELTMMVETARKVVRDEIIEPKLDMAYDRSGDFPRNLQKVVGAGPGAVGVP